MFLDELGLIVQANGDGGDTLARTGNYYALRPDLKEDFERAITWLESEPGVYVRHPVVAIKRPDFPVSRDQQLALIIALGEHGKKAELRRLLWKQIKNFGRYPNGDLPGASTVSAYIRGLAPKWLYPILWLPLELLDIVSLGDVALRAGILPRWKHETKQFVAVDLDDTGDDVLLCNRIINFRRHFPTIAGFIVARLYGLTRKTNYGVLALQEKSKVMGALSWYFRPETGGNWEIAEAYRAHVARFIDGRAK